MSQYTKFIQLWWCNELLYDATGAFAKASIAIFLMRICVKRYQHTILWLVVIVITVFAIYYMFLIVFQCHPVSYFWTQFSGESGACVSANFIANSTYAHCSLNVFVDIILCILPVFVIWNLNMNQRAKVLVTFILSLGAWYSLPLLIYR